MSIDPTHFQISRQSIAYCKRTKRKLEREPNRKVTIATGTRSLRIINAMICAYPKRIGLDDLDKLLGTWVKGKTIVADTEFDAEERFHQLIIIYPMVVKVYHPYATKTYRSGAQKGRDAKNSDGNGQEEAIEKYL